jgi:hypothetical protein
MEFLCNLDAGLPIANVGETRVVRGALQFLLRTLAVGAIGVSSVARAADVPYGKSPSSPSCTRNSDPYQNYQCLDAYLGEDFFTRFLNYYLLEWGRTARHPIPRHQPPLALIGQRPP